MSDEDDEDDPFADLDEEGDDPFAELGETSGSNDAGDATEGDDISEVAGIEREDVSLGGGTDDGDDPFAALGEAPADEDVFEDLGVEHAETAPEVTDDSEPDEVGTETGGDGNVVVVVPKRRYCQDCEFFESPPTVGCTHPEAEILELVDVDSFKLRNCPVVAQRRRAGMVSEGDITVVEEGTTDAGED